jgi:hypothetical protein
MDFQQFTQHSDFSQSNRPDDGDLRPPGYDGQLRPASCRQGATVA